MASPFCPRRQERNMSACDKKHIYRTTTVAIIGVQFFWNYAGYAFIAKGLPGSRARVGQVTRSPEKCNFRRRK